MNQRKRYGKAASFSRLASKGDGTSIISDRMLYNGKTKAGSANPLAPSLVHTEKPFKKIPLNVSRLV